MSKIVNNCMPNVIDKDRKIIYNRYGDLETPIGSRDTHFFTQAVIKYSINTRNPCVRVHTHGRPRGYANIQTAFTGAISALDLAVIALRYISFVRAFGQLCPGAFYFFCLSPLPSGHNTN